MIEPVSYHVDISRGSNYYQIITSRGNQNRNRPSKQAQEYLKAFDRFHEIAFDKRAHAESIFSNDGNAQKNVNNLLNIASMKTAYHLELGKSKEEQLKDMRKFKQSMRPGILKIFPESVLKFYDYLVSLRIEPKKSDLTRNVLFGLFFSFVVWANMSARTSFMYFVVGNLALTSLLLTRNMPQQKVLPGMERKKLVSWSKNSFWTAAAITILSTLTSGGLTALVTLPFKIKSAIKFKAAMIVSMLSTSYLTSLFEVFEEKGKNGIRWEKAVEKAWTPDLKSKLSDTYMGSAEIGDKYEYSYDPHVAEFPPRPKYIDELQPKAQTIQGGSGELDETESSQHFESWRNERKDSRRAPVLEAPPETPWVGGKSGMYVDKIPTWLSTAYKQYVTKANAWRSLKPKYLKDTKEFDLVDGPKGFRDRRPEWMDLFGTGIWEEQITVSRRAARAFGSYRKSMWKIDKDVVLLKCDGADKDDGKGKDVKDA